MRLRWGLCNKILYFKLSSDQWRWVKNVLKNLKRGQKKGAQFLVLQFNAFTTSSRYACTETKDLLLRPLLKVTVPSVSANKV